MFDFSGRARDRYVRRVIRWTERSLVELSKELGIEVRIVRVTGVQRDWRLCITVDETEHDASWRDFERAFHGLSEDVNKKFEGERWYYGIEIEVPFRLLGKLGARARLEQIERDYDTVHYRRVRLADGD